MPAPALDKRDHATWVDAYPEHVLVRAPGGQRAALSLRGAAGHGWDIGAMGWMDKARGGSPERRPICSESARKTADQLALHAECIAGARIASCRLKLKPKCVLLQNQSACMQLPRAPWPDLSRPGTARPRGLHGTVGKPLWRRRADSSCLPPMCCALHAHALAVRPQHTRTAEHRRAQVAVCSPIGAPAPN